MIRFRAFLLHCGLVVALGVLGPAAHAERKAAPVIKAPPQPVPASVRVKRDERVDIPLRIYGSRSQTLEFRIRTAPRSGKLSEVKPVEQEAALVTYTPPADLAVMGDRFTYAVRSKEGVSAPVEVTITILDAAPMLMTPPELEFPAILAGATSEQEFEIVNRGGGTIVGEIAIDAPWRIDASREYRLGPGERRSFKIRFAPVESGDFRGEIRYGAQPERATSLRGSALAPIAFTAAVLELKQEPNGPVRVGTFGVTNRGSIEQTLAFTATDRLAFARTLTLPAGDTANVTIRTAANDMAPLAAEIRAEAGGVAATLPVAAAPVGALLRTNRSALFFDQTHRAELLLENAGGTAANVTLEIAPPFSLARTSERIEPGERKTIALGFHSPGEGLHRATLKIRSENNSLEVPVEARVASAPLPKQRAAPRKPTPAAILVKAPQAPAEADEIDAPRRVRPSEVTTNTAAIEWPAVLSSAPRFRAEERRLSVRGGELKIDWVACSNFMSERRGDLVAGTFTGLKPGEIYVMRIVPIEADNKAGAPLLEVQFRTYLKPPSMWRLTPMRILVLVLCICAGLLVWQRRRRRMQ